MAELLFRKKSSLGKTSYTPNSEEEASIYTICIATEGEVEELQYIKGYAESFLKNSKVSIRYANDNLNENEKHSAHPKCRLQQLLRFRASIHPNWNEYTNDLSWLICDRDSQSFKGSQYDDIMQKCNENKITFIVSNPAFQLWLLMHFVKAIDSTYIKDNYNTTKNQRIYIEREIRKYIPYQHGQLNFGSFKDYVTNALECSNSIENDIKKLKNNIGTNFSSLIEKLLVFKAEEP